MKTVCIKIGGSTVDAPGLLKELGSGLRKMLDDNYYPVIVHGGGKDIARNLDRLQKEFTFIEGQRVTDLETMRIVQMVLSGDVNKRIVNALLMQNVSAIGVSGVDNNLFEAEKLLINGQDIGFVGTVRNVNTDLVKLFESTGLIGVISPVSRNHDGQIFNVNADLAAGKLAIALKVDHLIFVSDVPGVLIDGSVKKEIKINDIEKLITQGHITGGMIPKLCSAKDAVRRGVGRVHICSWYGKNTLPRELTVDTSQGTVIY